MVGEGNEPRLHLRVRQRTALRHSRSVRNGAVPLRHRRRLRRRRALLLRQVLPGGADQLQRRLPRHDSAIPNFCGDCGHDLRRRRDVLERRLRVQPRRGALPGLRALRQRRLPLRQPSRQLRAPAHLQSERRLLRERSGSRSVVPQASDAALDDAGRSGCDTFGSAGSRRLRRSPGPAGVSVPPPRRR